LFFIFRINSFKCSYLSFLNMPLDNIFLEKNYTLASWFFNKSMINIISTIMGVGVQKATVVSGFDIVIELIHKNIYPILLFLNNHTIWQFKNLTDIICYDVPKKFYRFSLVYNLISIHYNLRLRVLTKINELSKIFSVVGLYKSANWSEREIFDFFGVFFWGNKDLRRILTDYGFKGFPLRKNFPLTGYIDVFYDDNQKRICYRNLELIQEYRNFSLKNSW
jgi:NADH:ubiquinone oxidoreductase subunit C